MSIDRHKSELARKHEGLEEALKGELSRPAIDDGKVKRIKAAKLKVKDEIASIDRRH